MAALIVASIAGVSLGEEGGAPPAATFIAAVADAAAAATATVSRAAKENLMVSPLRSQFQDYRFAL